MAREFQNESGSQLDTAANVYRVDPAWKRTTNRGGSADVPVLFRLQNLQRNQELSVAAIPKVAAHASSDAVAMNPSGSRSATKVPANRQAQLSATPEQPKLNSSSVESEQFSSSGKPNLERIQSPNRPWSTNVILLAVGFAVVFMLYKNNSSDQSRLASNSSTTPGVATTTLSNTGTDKIPNGSSAQQSSTLSQSSTDLSQTTTHSGISIKADPFLSLEPLVAPKLPEPISLSLDDNKSPNEKGSELLDRDQMNKGSLSNDLTVDGSVGSEMTIPAENFDRSTAHKSVLIPDESTPSNKSLDGFQSNSTSQASRQPRPTVISNPHVALGASTSTSSNTSSNTQVATKPSQLVSTSTPELETSELFELRRRHSLATMESQQQAMAVNRQQMMNSPTGQLAMGQQAQQPTEPLVNTQWSNPQTPAAMTVSGPAFQPPITQPSITQSRPSYVPPATQAPTYQYQPVQPAPQGYGMTSTNPAPLANSTSTTPAAVNRPYVPISSTFANDPYMTPDNYANQPQPLVPGQGPISNQFPTSGGYQPLSPQFQFQSQPTNGN